MDIFNKKPKFERRVFSVSELTSEIKGLLEGGFPHLWVEGEISNFTGAQSGHCYFTLKDSGAQISCVMFRNQARLLPFVPRDGMQVQCRGRINVYEPRGNYQLLAEWIEDRGEGRLRELYEKLKVRLEDEGLFDEAHKKRLPQFPQCIALVTSPHGAAVCDMIRVIHRRNPHVKLIVFPTLVQGEGAVQQIIAAIESADSREDVDLIILGRGGGSIEDLWAFNDESLARTIYNCDTPVISAVGHEVDFTIADFVSDVRAATPSVAGELAVPEYLALKRELSAYLSGLHQSMRRRLTEEKLQLKSASHALRSPAMELADKRLLLDSLWHRLVAANRQKLDDSRTALDRSFSMLTAFNPAMHCMLWRGRLSELSKRLDVAERHLLAKSKENLVALASRLNALSPLAVMERGYSLALDEKFRVVRDAETLSVGQKLLVRMHRGEAVTRVESITREGGER